MTTRVLMLLRHGKSDWDADYASDHERPLARRGVRAAKRIGRFLSQAGWAPDLVITSTALRARATVELVAGKGGWTCPIRNDRCLYDADSTQVLEEIRRLPDDTSRVLLAGHEPTSSELLALLIGGGQIRFPTAAVAAVSFTAEHWRQVQGASGELLWLIVPRLLGT